MFHKRGDPAMSDAFLLLRVEDLISIAFGPPHNNTMNFKILQSVLHILARQMRLLEQMVDLRITESDLSIAPDEEKSPEGKRKGRKEKERTKGGAKAERGYKSDVREQAKDAKDKDKGEKYRTKEDGATSKDKKEGRKGRGRDETKKSRDESERRDYREESVDRDEQFERGGKDYGGKGGYEKDKVKYEKDESEEYRGRDRSGGKAEKDYDGERDREDDKRSEKSGGRSEKDRGEESSRGRDGKGRVKADKNAMKKTSGTSISVSEREDKDQKILIVEKGPTTRKTDTSHVGSIEVVTQSQFKLLDEAVRYLENKAGPMPLPTLPDNKKLRDDLAKGNASLTDTMQAMQITARIQAAEKAIQRLAEMTTELAAKGGMPRELARKAAALQSDVMSLVQEAKSATNHADTTSTAHSIQLNQSKSATSRKASQAASVATGTTLHTIEPPRPRSHSIQGNASQATSVSRTASAFSSYGKYVTSDEMHDVLQALKEELLSNGKAMTTRAQTVADCAAHTAAELLKKLEIALKIDSRITTLCSVVEDYEQQFSGFDEGIGTQMTSFKEQMQDLYRQLSDGLTQFANISNNAETAAMKELSERFDGLDYELKDSQLYHQNLSNFQEHLSEELSSLVQCVEILREQKADREEVQDGLRDKADISRLTGLLTEEVFDKERCEIELRLHLCHKKFSKQEAVWVEALKDLKGATGTKAEHLQLLCARAEAEDSLRDLHARVQLLTRILGDPKTAVMTRQLAKDGVCGACRVPAVMPIRDSNEGPPRLPAARPPPAGAPADQTELCSRDDLPYDLDEPPEGKSHMCLRWVGGSHTLINATRKRAPPFQVQLTPVKRYIGMGSDSKPYKMAEDLLPCMECNQVTLEKIPGEADGPLQPSEVGAGDQVTVIKASEARRVTIIDQENFERVADGKHRPSTEFTDEVDKTSTSHLIIAENAKTSTTSTAVESDASKQFVGASSALFAYDDKQRRLTDVGNIVRGRVTAVDENAARRASVRHDAAVRRATIAEGGNDHTDGRR